MPASPPAKTLLTSLACAGLALVGSASTAAADQPASSSAATASSSTEVSVSLPPRMTAPEFKMGDAKAKVIVVEYASDTCSHCARFAAEVFPEFKKKYIDTGKVLYVFREFPTDPVQLSGAGFVLARCAGQDKYYAVVNALFLAQKTSKTGLEFLNAGAKAGDLSEQQMRACFKDPAAVADLAERVRAAVEDEKIDGTPAFLVNGKKIAPGEKSLVELQAVIDPLLAADVAPKHRRS